MTRQELTKNFRDQLEGLVTETDKAKRSEKYKAFLDAMSGFHNYSYMNQVLIACQKRGATRVAGFRQWKKKFNRQVMRGSKALYIWAPTFKKYEDKDGQEENVLMGFVPVAVFDVSDTEGDEIASWALPLSGDDGGLSEVAMRFAKDEGLDVEVKSIAGEWGSTNGKDVSLNAGLKGGGKFRVLVHEIAHTMLHWDENRKSYTVKQKEVESETISYVVGKHFGIDGSDSAEYLANYNFSREDLEYSLERISKTAKKIINGIESLTVEK
jgi:hypothetical protein